MNDDFGDGGPFERRRSNRAVVMVVGMAFAAMALNHAVHAFTTSPAATHAAAKRAAAATPVPAQAPKHLPPAR